MQTITYSVLVLFTKISIILNISSCHSQIWGKVHPSAIPIYDIDISLNREKDNPRHVYDDTFVEIQYPTQGSRNEYIITMMVAYDESKFLDVLEEHKHSAISIIVTGGVGCNYTIVRFESTVSTMNLNFVIFGVHPKVYI